MPLPRYERVAQDLAGNALGGASVEVFYAGSTSKPTLYSDEDGNNTKSNPFTADSTGYFFFYVADGIYDVKVTYGATSVTYQNQQIFHPANRVSKAGDTMTGALTLAGDPTANLHAATKQYIDARAASKKRSMVLVIPGTQRPGLPSPLGSSSLAGGPSRPSRVLAGRLPALERTRTTSSRTEVLSTPPPRTDPRGLHPMELVSSPTPFRMSLPFLPETYSRWILSRRAQVSLIRRSLWSLMRLKHAVSGT
jgi:hypothetical protein